MDVICFFLKFSESLVLWQLVGSSEDDDEQEDDDDNEGDDEDGN